MPITPSPLLLDPADNSDTYGERCSESEVLQHLLEVESSRQRLERYARELSRLAEFSVNATRDAQQVAKHKADLLSTLSHEIRTPLNGILGMASLLASCELDPTPREYVETIRQAGESLLVLIDDVLDFSKMEADRLELNCDDLSLQKLVEDALRLVRPAAERKCLKLVSEIGPEVPAVIHGDALRLRQILLNYLSNAIKFTSTGKIALRVEPALLPCGSTGLRFVVTDSGIGISPEGQARLFQPFSQADSSVARQFGGTGLGLAICKRLAVLMGGSVGLVSKVGLGSSFWFTIKIQSPQSVAAPSTTQPAVATPAAAAPSELAAEARILLVDDNPINQKIATLILKKAGYTATVVSNGSEAVRAVAESTFDLIFMDCLMPEMDGYQATRAIRQGPNNGSSVPIIAMTGNVFSEDREACLAVGMSGFLAKPVREAELLETLATWLPKRTQTEPTAVETTLP